MNNLSVLSEEYLTECSIRNFSVETIKNKKIVANEFIRTVGDLELDKVTKATVKKFIVAVSERKKASTINTCLRNLKGWFKFLVEEEYIGSNPFDKVEALKEEKTIIRTYSVDVVGQIFEKFWAKDFNTERNKLIVITLVETGIRVSELCTILLEDVLDTSIKIHGKGNKVRYVPITEAIAKQLAIYMIQRNEYLGEVECDNLFVSKFRKALTRTGVNQLMTDKVFKGIDDTDGVAITVHNFRRFFAQNMLDNVDVYTVSRLMGHSKITTTERYLRGTENAKILERGMNSPMKNLFK